MNLNLAVKLNIHSRDLETKLYLFILFLVTSIMAIWIYSIALSMYSEDNLNSTSGFNIVRPQWNDEKNSAG